MDWVEVIAALFGLICVVLTVRQNIWCWPAGLVQVSLYIWVFYQARLYSDMWLHVIYVFMQFFGWYNWMYGGREKGRLEPTWLSPAGLVFWGTLAASGTAGLGFFMASFTRADLAYWDAATTVLSLIAQWLMAKKKLESWLIWITVDVLCIGIYLVKGLYPSTALYACFLVLAGAGFLSWFKDWKNLAPA